MLKRAPLTQRHNRVGAPLAKAAKAGPAAQQQRTATSSTTSAAPSAGAAPTAPGSASRRTGLPVAAARIARPMHRATAPSAAGAAAAGAATKPKVVRIGRPNAVSGLGAPAPAAAAPAAVAEAAPAPVAAVMPQAAPALMQVFVDDETEVFVGEVHTPERQIAAALKKRRRTLLRSVQTQAISTLQSAAAALRIQAAFRRWRVQRQYLKLRKAASTIARHWRRRGLRHRFRTLALQALASQRETLQRKSHVDRLMARHRAAVKLQRWWRLRLQRRRNCKLEGATPAAVAAPAAEAASTTAAEEPATTSAATTTTAIAAPIAARSTGPVILAPTPTRATAGASAANMLAAAAIAASPSRMASRKYGQAGRAPGAPSAVTTPTRAMPAFSMPVIRLPALPTGNDAASAAATSTEDSGQDALQAKRALLQKIRSQRMKLENQLLGQATNGGTNHWGLAARLQEDDDGGAAAAASSSNAVEDDIKSKFAALLSSRGRNATAAGSRVEDEAAERELQRITRLNTLHNSHSLVTFELPDPEDMERQERFLAEVDAMADVEEEEPVLRPTSRVRWQQELCRDVPVSPGSLKGAAPRVLRTRPENVPFPYANCLHPQRVKVLPKLRGSRRGSALLDSPMGLQELLASNRAEEGL